MAESTPLAYCTIVSESYLPKAMVLIESIRRIEPSRPIEVLLFDLENADSVEPIEGVTIRGWEYLGLPRRDYLQMSTYYDVYELATAIKPLLFRRLLGEYGGVVFLDPDITLYSPLAELPDLLAEHSVVLVPHVVMPKPWHDVVGEIVLRYGMWQLGFGAFGPGSEALLDWWWERNRRYCVAQPSRGYWCDQRWMDVAGILFSPIVHCLRHPGYDVGYWNLHERPLRIAPGGDIIVGPDGEPLRFYHFSGYWPGNSDSWAGSFAGRLGRPVDEETKKALRRLYADYEAALGSATARRTAPRGYHFAATAEGRQISPVERRVYREAILKGSDAPSLPTAFLPEDSRPYRNWHRLSTPRRLAGLLLEPVSYDLRLYVMNHGVPHALNVARDAKKRLKRIIGRPGPRTAT